MNKKRYFISLISQLMVIALAINITTVSDSVYAAARNTALYKSVTISEGNIKSNGNPINMVDGDESTFLETEGTFAEFEIDLGRYFAINRLRVIFDEGKYIYTVQSSTDQKMWTMVASDIDNTKGTEFIKFSPLRSRYVKLSVKSDNKNSIKIREFEVFGESMLQTGRNPVLSGTGQYTAKNLSLGKPASTNSFDGIDHSPDKAFDGDDGGTCWKPQTLPATITIDFEEETVFDKIVIKEKDNNIKAYTVEYSYDGVNFREYIKNGAKVGIKQTNMSTAVIARMARLTITEADEMPSIYEVEFYQSKPAQDLVIVSYDKLNAEANELMEKSDAVAMYIDVQFAVVNSDRVIINPADSEVCPKIHNGKAVVPLSFLSNVYDLKLNMMLNEKDEVVIKGKKISIEKIENEWYAPLESVAEALNRELYFDKDGLIVLSDKNNPVDFKKNANLMPEILMVLLTYTDKIPPLAETFKDYFPIGCMIADNTPEFDKPFIKKHFNSIVMEGSMKWANLQPVEGEFTFEKQDAWIDWALENNISIRGHCLVWDAAVPDWVFEDENGNVASRELLLKRMKDHIKAVLTHFKGRVYCWDVVNEILADDQHYMRDFSKWVQIIGEDVVKIAFQYAYEVDPDILLFYNDYNLESPGKRDKALKMIKDLQDAGVPIHGVGLQHHRGISWPTRPDVEAAIKDFAELGIEVQITELDVEIVTSGEKEASLANLEREAEIYKWLWELCMQYKGTVTGITMWGIADNHSWLNRNGIQEAPLMFDTRFNPKKAFWKVITLAK